MPFGRNPDKPKPKGRARFVQCKDSPNGKHHAVRFGDHLPPTYHCKHCGTILKK